MMMIVVVIVLRVVVSYMNAEVGACSAHGACSAQGPVVGPETFAVDVFLLGAQDRRWEIGVCCGPNLPSMFRSFNTNLDP